MRVLFVLGFLCVQLCAMEPQRDALLPTPEQQLLITDGREKTRGTNPLSQFFRTLEQVFQQKAELPRDFFETLQHNFLKKDIEQAETLMHRNLRPSRYLKVLAEEYLDDEPLDLFADKSVSIYEKAENFAPVLKFFLEVYLCKMEVPAIVMRRFAAQLIAPSIQKLISKVSIETYAGFVRKNNLLAEDHHIAFGKFLETKGSGLHTKLVGLLYPVAHLLSGGISGVSARPYKMIYLTPYIMDRPDAFLHLDRDGLMKQLKAPINLPLIPFLKTVRKERASRFHDHGPKERYDNLVKYSKSTAEDYNLLAFCSVLFRGVYYFGLCDIINYVSHISGFGGIAVASLGDRIFWCYLSMIVYYMFKIYV